MPATDKRASELTAPVSIADTDTFPGYRPGTGGEPNLDIRATAGLIRAPILAGLADGSVAVAAAGVGTSPVAAAASASFIPFQTIWLFELTCSAAGSAIVTLSGVRRDDATTETVATYSLAADETLVDANDRTDHVSFSWTKTGTGAVTARVL